MQSVRPVFNALTKQVRRYHGGHDFKAPSMNELPVPAGSWQRLHDERQRKYNGALLFGITMFSIGLFTLKASGLNLHRYAPEHYE